ncbi:MAG: ATP-binding protein [Salinivirgaceae bacterium]|nr:ATP-binding protein [Salinivirgaceae bacterium]
MERQNTVINNPILIKKATGEEQIFSFDKLEQSLQRAGAKPETIQLVLADMQKWIKPGFTTKMIYTRAFSFLRNEKTGSPIRYRLKQAMLEMGPSGYPFEILIGQLFSEEGFQTEVGQILQGMCISHEMDVIATQDQNQHLVECKYHKDQGKSVSIQVPLYVRARVNDIVDKRMTLDTFRDFKFTPWVVTNTRFSNDSVNYSRCKELRLLAWDYPSNNGLKEKLEHYKLYPITILTTLSLADKRLLLDKGWVSVKQLIENDAWHCEFEFSKRKYKMIKRELHRLLD